MVIFSKRKVALSVIAALTAQVSAVQAAAKEDVIVVTTASGFQQKIEDAAATISVVSREELEGKAYRDVTDALKDVPGVVVTGGGSSSDISIRGMDPKYTMILVDGKRVASRETRPNSDNSGIEQGWLPPLTAIERIEVVRGPMSSLYGSDAMGGVINIITRKAQGEWHTSIRTDATITESKNSGNTGQGSFYAAGPLIDNLLSMKVNGQYSHRGEDNFSNGFNRQIMSSGGGTLTLTPDEQNSIDFDFKKDNQHRDSRWEKSASESSKKKKSSGFSKYEMMQYALTHDGQYDWGSMNSYVQRNETKNPGRDMEYYDTIARNQTVVPLGDHMLSLGGQYRFEELKDNNNKLDGNKLERYSWALFAEDDWALTNDFTLTGGLRMDEDENFGTHWTPRVYGVWHLDESWSVKGGVSTGYRSPDLRQATASWGQATGGGNSNAVIFGNPELKPEKTVTEEISVMWNNQDNLNMSLTVFNTDFKDKITEIRRCGTGTDIKCTEKDPEGNDYIFVSDRINVDKANMRGVEAIMNWEMTDTLSLSANYTFTDSEQKSGKFKGKALNKTPKHMANATLDWDTTQDVKSWSRVNFRGKTSDYLSRTNMASGTGSYATVDIGGSYQLSKDLNFVAGVYNVLDRRIDMDDYGATLDGRRYNIGMNYNF
ncbi:ligand-gated channel protein [Morganella psychrotolerans]|uniref:Ligand-gated channel protein n=1 Tax=Morganella psychrotolerans TaxID=368603 RepID=A0A5M9R9Q6_9GAMM|nr:ligand-gated channel protein [Morganella psychrotolerans]KAA8717694.1 ligand-gated channel protein [Morganella psychrotolerans]OBU08060.1 outer membrane siderophore receptor [Morganella psychrotolerans]